MNRPGHYSEQQYTDQQYAAQAAQAAFPPSSSIAVFFKVHPTSDFHPNLRIWIETLTSVSIDELRQLAVAKFPGTVPLRIEGIIKDPSGHEMELQIDQDEELDAYLAAITGVNKPTFSVQLVSGWKE